jgi:hypothetical protein
VHLADFPMHNEKLVDKDLEEKMDLAQKASSMILALTPKRKTESAPATGKNYGSGTESAFPRTI